MTKQQKLIAKRIDQINRELKTERSDARRELLRQEENNLLDLIETTWD